MAIVVRKYSGVIIIKNNNNIASLYLWLYFLFFSLNWWTIKHLLDSAGSNIQIYSVEIKISDETEGRVGYFLARVNKS